MRFLTLVVLVVLVGCVQSRSKVCGDTICSQASVCSPAGDTCVLPAQVDACAGHGDEDFCSFAGVEHGLCYQNVCVPSGCGNKIVERDIGEVCDDGNLISFDGCSADCRSAEMCGDGAIDFAVGEQCDDGDMNSQAPGASCRIDCTRQRCGDGVVDPGELCDDGNNNPGDGCRADCLGRWTPMVSATFQTLSDVSAISESDAWASGELRILHWDGSQWQRMPTPPTTFQLIGEFVHIWASASNDVYTLDISGPTAVYHWDGTSWTNVAAVNGYNWRDVYGRNKDDVWLVGGPAGQDLAAHWDGVSWTVYPNSISRTFFDAWVDPNGLLYAIAGGNVYTRVVGGPWVPAPGAPTNVTVVAGAAANDVSTFTSHFDGASWTTQTGSDEMNVAALSAVPAEQIALGFMAGQIMVCSSGACTISPSPVQQGLSAVSAYIGAHGEHRAFIVGQNGTILY